MSSPESQMQFIEFEIELFYPIPLAQIINSEGGTFEMNGFYFTMNESQPSLILFNILNSTAIFNNITIE